MTSFKPLLIYNRRTFIENIVLKLHNYVNNINIVTGKHSELLMQSLKHICDDLPDKIYFLHNPEYEKGMLSSLKKGVSHIKRKSEWIMYHFVDQPHLPNQFYKEFIKQADQKYQWIQPENAKRRGHPILFNYTLIDPILNIPEGHTLKSLTGIKKKYWACSYTQIHDDFDTDEDYKRLITTAVD